MLLEVCKAYGTKGIKCKDMIQSRATPLNSGYRVNLVSTETKSAICGVVALSGEEFC